jgi:hypothetical protein
MIKSSRLNLYDSTNFSQLFEIKNEINKVIFNSSSENEISATSLSLVKKDTQGNVVDSIIDAVSFINDINSRLNNITLKFDSIFPNSGAGTVIAPNLITPHNLTTNTSDPNFIITVSSVRAGDGYKAFNGLFFWPEMWESRENTFNNGNVTNLDNFDAGTGPISGPWLKITLNEPKQFNRYRIARNDAQHTSTAPVSWRLYGKNENDSNYTLIESVDNFIYQTFADYEPTRSIQLSTFKYIVFHVVQVASNNWCGIGELDFYKE